VLIGGAVALVLYVVPVVGFLVYKLLGFFGFGAVVYTLVLRVRARRAVGIPPANNTAAAAMTGPGWTASAAAETFAAGPPPFSAPPPGAPPATPPAAAPASVTREITAAMPRAGFWVRMGALFLDILLVGFATSLLHPFGNVHMLGDFHIVVLAIYGAVMWKLRGTTVGGIVFDLHVVRVDGRPVDWETAIVRALGFPIAVRGLPRLYLDRV
jgi:uncharacterized RDD family membrane protein YckC